MLNTKNMFKSPLQINAFLLHPKHALLIICIKNTSQNRAGTRMNASEYYSLVCFFRCVFFFFFFVTGLFLSTWEIAVLTPDGDAEANLKLDL